MDNLKEAFKTEALELLAELETSLLELEEAPDDAELVGRVFRAMHTIKGSGAMFGFDDIAEFTHEVETIFDLVREGKLAVTQELIDLTLSARDQIKAMLDAADGAGQADGHRAGEIIESLRQLLPGLQAPCAPSADRQGPVTYRIRFRPARNLFSTGTNPVFLLNELRELGDCHVVALTEEIPVLSEMDAESCYTYWDVILTTERGIDAIRDVFIFVEDDCEILIRAIDEEHESDDGADYRRLGEILVDRGDLSPLALKEILEDRKRIGEILVEKEAVFPGAVESALVEQRHVQKIRQKRNDAAAAGSIRVDAEKLDGLVNLVGELVTVQARLSQKAAVQKDPELLLISEVLERLTGELRNNAMSIRMLPIGTTFSKFKRLVRDLSNTLGKEVVMTTDGAETELDKTVIEQLNDPLVHIIRNSIDHGIELPGIREAAGKPRQGTVHLSAEHSGAHVLIRISDDGAGLDQDAIRARALERGLLAPDAQPTEKEIFSLVFAPGFSTAAQVTDISGRGVGMDVVKRCLEALRGTIDVASRKGSGTTITLKLPLTLAIIDGLRVKIGDVDYVIPLSSVEECVELTRSEADVARVRNMIDFRGKVLPYLSLRERFMTEGEPPALEQVVVAEANGDRVGFGVDRVIGQYQTVIKTLGRLYRDARGFSGATILGDGTVALILDIPQLLAAVDSDEAVLH